MMPASQPLPFPESPAPTPPQTPNLALEGDNAYSGFIGDMDDNARFHTREIVVGVSSGASGLSAVRSLEDTGSAGPLRRQEDADYVSRGDLDSYGYGDGAGAFGFGSLDVAPVGSQTWSRGDSGGDSRGSSRTGSRTGSRGWKQGNTATVKEHWLPSGDGGGGAQQQQRVQHFPQRPPSGGPTDFLRRRKTTPQKARRLARPKSMDGGSRPLSDTGRQQFQMAALSEAEKLFGEISRGGPG